MRERVGEGEGGKGVGSLAGRGWSRKVGPLSQSLSGRRENAQDPFPGGGACTY